MKAKRPQKTQPKNNILRIALISGLLLLIPLWGNTFVAGWNWDLADFIFAGIFFFVAGLVLDFAAKKITNPVHRVIALVAIVAAFLLLWAELAVGLVEELVIFMF